MDKDHAIACQALEDETFTAKESSS